MGTCRRRHGPVDRTRTRLVGLGLFRPAGLAALDKSGLGIGICRTSGRNDCRIKGPKPKLRAQFGDLAKILPHNSVELCWFIPAAVTAGVCEEWLFRGYLIWAFEPYLGWWAGALLSWAFFTAAHAYQGKSGTKQSGIVAAIMTLIVAVTGSLLPVIALHVAIDVTSGIMGWLVLRDEPSILHAEKPF
jgi:membrane protease YdiL (CAAX protease family)